MIFKFAANKCFKLTYIFKFIFPTPYTRLNRISNIKILFFIFKNYVKIASVFKLIKMIRGMNYF